MSKLHRADATNELVSLISGIKRSLQGRTYTCKDGTQLTNGQLGLLFMLKHHSPISAQDIASKLAMTPGAVSQLIDSLLVDEYISRTPRKDDRRVLDITLSEHGLRQVTSIERERHMVIQEMTSDLTDDELTQLISALQKMLQALQKQTK